MPELLNVNPEAKPPVLDLYLLTWTAGVMDALSYVRANVFTANMTGNTVVLGLALAGTDRWRVFHSALAICAFAAGVLFGGAVLVRMQASDERADLRMGTSLEIPFAIAFSVLWLRFPSGGPAWALAALIAAAACALGIQSAAVWRLRIRGAVTTFLTGTITSAIVSVLERNEPAPSEQNDERSSPALLGGMIVLYIAAAFTGAFLSSVNSPLAAVDAILPLLIVLVRAWLTRPVCI